MSRSPSPFRRPRRVSRLGGRLRPLAGAAARVLAVLLLASPAAGGPEVRLVKPQATGPGIRDVELPNADGYARHHVVATDAERDAARLFLFLPGTGAAPTQYVELARTAAELGFDVVGLVYDSWPSVNGLAAGSSDPTLPERIRRERLFGEDLVAGPIDVDKPNAVVNRLEALLRRLHRDEPEAGWDRYLDPSGGPRWERIAVGGHSQGAGHAAYLSRLFPLAGVVLLGGPGDFVPDLGPAPWLFRPAQVAPGRMSGLVHVEDPSAAGFFLTQSILGLEGPVEVVDGDAEEAIASSRLATALPPDGGNPHSAVAVDAFLPRDEDGTPLHRAAWRSMLGRMLPEPTSDRR